MIILLIYLIGCIIAFWMLVYGDIKKSKVLTLAHIYLDLFFAFFSWGTVIADFIMISGDIVIYEKE